MPPREYSRHTFTETLSDSKGRSFLSDRIPFRFQKFSDTREHIVQQGETLYSLAGRYFVPIVRPAGLWWVVADFQPQPIYDPTIQLQPGRRLFIPSVRTVVETILNENRRSESIL